MSEEQKKRARGKYVVMRGSNWHTEERLENICYETRVDSFVLACFRILKRFDVSAQAVPFEEIFTEWQEVHNEILRGYYGCSVEAAEIKTDSWLTTIQVVGQGIREFIYGSIFENPEEYIFLRRGKTHFIVEGVVIAEAHLSVYEGSPRSETKHLFFQDPFIIAFYKKAGEKVV